jgi:hypothetical protein
MEWIKEVGSIYREYLSKTQTKQQNITMAIPKFLSLWEKGDKIENS